MNSDIELGQEEGGKPSPQKIELRYTYEMDGDFFVGCLDGYPEYPTQGQTLKDFEENLLDIYQMIQDGSLDTLQKHGVLEIAV
jgi:hypothetical protein